ncbi:MAG: SpoIVB peptidase S55 domain-containing protein [Clostridia bacterium]
MNLSLRRICAICLAFAILFLPIGIETASAEVCDEVILGGCPIGLELNIDGVVVVDIEKEVGVLRNSELIAGDLIVKASGIRVKNINTLIELVNARENSIELVVLRDGVEEKVTVGLTKDKATGRKKMNVIVKDIIQGVGTLTYVKDDLSFGSLGHAASMIGKKTVTPICGGKPMNCLIIGVNKGLKGKAGDLKGVFVLNDALSGKVAKNNEFGVFGKFNSAYQNPVYNGKVKVARRGEVEIGKATILTTIDGNTPKEFSIEIVQKENQSSPSTKGLVIKVTDEELLAKTGGIVQGMSGSPIIQNGKFIGAVTHVFVNDPTRGFGLYAEFMVEN